MSLNILFCLKLNNPKQYIYNNNNKTPIKTVNHHFVLFLKLQLKIVLIIDYYVLS